MEVPNSLVSTWLPTQITDIEVTATDGAVNATIGDYGTIVSRRLINDEGDKVTMKNAGFALVWQFADNVADLAPSDGSEWHDPDLPMTWIGRSGAVGQITWSCQLKN